MTRYRKHLFVMIVTRMVHSLQSSRDGGRSLTLADVVTWRVARGAFWSCTWRIYLGLFAAGLVVIFLAKYFGAPSLVGDGPQGLEELRDSLPPALAELIAFAELGLIVHSFRVTARKHLPEMGIPVSWGDAAVFLWGSLWRFMPGIMGAFLLVMVAIKVGGIVLPPLLPENWLGLIIVVVLVMFAIIWPFYAGQVWAMRGGLRAVYKRISRRASRPRRLSPTYESYPTQDAGHHR